MDNSFFCVLVRVLNNVFCIWSKKEIMVSHKSLWDFYVLKWRWLSFSLYQREFRRQVLFRCQVVKSVRKVLLCEKWWFLKSSVSERPCTCQDMVFYWGTKQLSNGGLFPCLRSLISAQTKLGLLESVMQTRYALERLHNCWEFFQLLECLYEAM